MRLFGAALLAALAAMSAVSARTHRASKKTPPAASASRSHPPTQPAIRVTKGLAHGVAAPAGAGRSASTRQDNFDMERGSE